MSESLSIEFEFDVVGRIRNLSLPPSPINALIPIFEAVSNSIHAIEARFGDASSDEGRISIEIVRRKLEDGSDGSIFGFIIQDNGIGLTSENFNSFRVSDSSYKIRKGGKGIGRLSWLKTFKTCSVESHFIENGETTRRSFKFSLSAKPISDHILEKIEGEIGTKVLLENYDFGYEGHCPKKSETIAAKIVGHFLPYFVVGSTPAIFIFDGNERIDVKQFYTAHQERSATDSITLSEENGKSPDSLEIHHILLRKALKFQENGTHWLFYGANNRVVVNAMIDNQVGLKYVGPNEDCVYIGLISGAILDDHVNQERTNFSLSDGEFNSIHKFCVSKSKDFLFEYIEKVRELQKERVSNVITSNPQFLPFRDNLDEFVRTKLSLNVQTEEEIYIELSRHKLRSKRKIESDIRKFTSGTKADINESVQKMTHALNADVKSSLAEYVVRRKQVLELLDSSLSYKNPEKRDHLKEEAVHELICPMRSSSDDLEYDDHNLWILDDRLAFYTFFQSDKPFSTFVEGSDSHKEPDIAVMFDRSLAFQREGKDEPIVIIEFKKPGRDNYTYGSSPINQVLDYVDKFRAGSSVTNHKGRLVRKINSSTRFICYIVADITDSLTKVIRSSVAQNQTADGGGYFGYSPAHNAYVEVIPYDKVLSDSRIRNEAFFSRLKLI